MPDNPIDLAALTKDFPREAIQQRTGGGGKKLEYLEGSTIIHRLNDATGNRWDFAVLAFDSMDLGNGNRLLTARCRLTIPGLGSREHIGVQLVSDRGGEDLLKGAITDSLKKCATLFGVGLQLYGRDYEAGEAPPARSTPLLTTPARPSNPGHTQRATEASVPSRPINLGPLFGDLDRAGVNKEDQHPMAHDIGCVWFDLESLTDMDHEQLGRMRRMVQTKPVEELYEKWNIAKLKIEERMTATGRMTVQERKTTVGQLTGMPQPVREYGS